MSIKHSNDIDLLEKLIIEERIKLYEYSDFKNIQPIGKGSFGKVVRVNCKTTDHFFALKSFDNDEITLKEVVKELKLHRNVDFHENIVRIFGVTKEETNENHSMRRYSFVLEYADNGTLSNYLTRHFNELNWNDKNQLALQLASAVTFIHNCNIIHRDLHANNILIHQKNIKLADFGLSKKIDEKSSNTSKIIGVIPYIDPKSLDNRNYKLNKKSDVYSIGVVMWQISSGYKPYRDVDYDGRLILDILNGKREEIIDGTSVEYSSLYKKCWKLEPSKRPDMQEVVLILKSIISSRQEYVNIENIINEENKNYTIENYQFDLKSNDEMLDMNKSLEISNLQYQNSFQNRLSALSCQEIDINKSLMISSSRNHISIQNRNSLSLSSLSSQVTKTSSLIYDNSDNIIDNINNKIVDELIKYVIKKHDNGITFDQIKQFISQQISKLDHAMEKLIKWLLKNQTKSQHIFSLGLFYYYNIGVKEDSIKAFKLFLKASEDNYSIAQVYLAKCHNDGYGTECNKKLAFDWYKKSAENRSIIGQFYLGYCYEIGIGIRDGKKSVYWYKKAANNGNTTAKLYLAECYRLGKGVEKNEVEALKYYKELAKKEVADAQFQLGNCFYYGIGIKLDRIEALYWYRKSTINGNIAAKYILEKHYNEKIKNKVKNNPLIKINQLGLYYIGKILIKTSYEKSFFYFQKAAENGYKVAQHNLGECYRNGIGVRKDERKAFELFKKSAEQGYNDAKFRLGYCYDVGIGTDINKVKAFELYKVAAEKGDDDAQIS
ncbi:kinase-like domain-containing protein [Rhizophagus clarus]|uniref:Kinase-like domain-containing protein n=1 Tax=Rhizophagus clarus TaxID=94130 RepID=A0A8H3LBE2_9GLOM|nr:kinase-like domain-containing protein [Rhizophagus clarus]